MEQQALFQLAPNQSSLVKKTPRKRRAKALKVTPELECYLFPEEYPKEQEAINQANWSWSSSDVWSAANYLLTVVNERLIEGDGRCGFKTLYEDWLWVSESLDEQPFSFVHCLKLVHNIDKGVNFSELRIGYAERIVANRHQSSAKQRLIQEYVSPWLHTHCR